MAIQWRKQPEADMSPIPDGVLDCSGGMMVCGVYYTRLGLSEMSHAEIEQLVRKARTCLKTEV